MASPASNQFFGIHVLKVYLLRLNVDVIPWESHGPHAEGSLGDGVNNIVLYTYYHSEIIIVAKCNNTQPCSSYITALITHKMT